MTRVYSFSTWNRHSPRNWTDAVQSSTPVLLTCLCRSPERRRLMRGSSAVSLLGFRVWIPRGMDVCLSLESVICCQVEVFTSGWSSVQTSLTECGACECDREASTVRIPWATRSCRAKENSYAYDVPSYELLYDTFQTTFTFSWKYSVWLIFMYLLPSASQTHLCADICKSHQALKRWMFDLYINIPLSSVRLPVHFPQRC
jgi:hypothetical protein